MTEIGLTKAMPPQSEISTALKLLSDLKAGCVELRALLQDRTVLSGYYNDLNTLAKDAEELDQSGKARGIFITLNPVKTALLSHSFNKIARSSKATTDQNIASRRLLLIDFDSVRESKTSATDSEHEAAINRAFAVRDWLQEIGWPIPVIADSGNGAHLIYRIELPNDSEAKALIKRVLATIAEHYSDDAVKVDTSVFNAARIVKLYGTTARKGNNTQERPHRRSYIIEAPATLESVTLSQLQAFVPSDTHMALVKETDGPQIFNTWDELNDELRRRIMAHPTRQINNKGWFHCKGICHKGNGDTAIMFNPATGAVKCMAGCSHSEMLRAFKLPTRPFSASSASSAELPSIEMPELVPQALYGLAGDIVRLIEPHSEADPVAILIQFLVAFGSIIGRDAYFTVEAAQHYLNLFVVLIGATSKGRKGTSWGQVRRFLKDADENWINNCIHNGLSSGEGLIWAVRDEIEKQEAIKEKGRIVGYQMNVIDSGVTDKRALIIEQEFASVLRVMSREGNTISAIIRQAWDTGDLRVMTRNSPARATGAHVSIIGHITKDELKRNLKETETANGFANRFLWVSVRRSKLLPEGGSLSDYNCNQLIERLKEAVSWVRNEKREMARDDNARALWKEIYEELSIGHTGLLGAVTSRAEAQVMRLACLYALLDKSALVSCIHLESALALWRYCEASARYVFGDATRNRIADEVMIALHEAADKGMTQTELNNLFSGHKKSGSIVNSLTMLYEQGRITYKMEDTGGRPSKRWLVVTQAAE
jgi:hypothetical protein